MREPTSTSHDESIPLRLHAEGNGATAEGLPVDLEKRARVLQTIMFTDIESSVNLAGTLGADRYAEVLTRHGDLFYEALATATAAKIEKHTGDGFMARFDQPSEAVGVALRFQWLLRREDWGIGHPLRVRIGIHRGEILLIPTVREMPGTIGTAVNLAARVTGMADGGQVLMTREVFDDARQSITALPGVPAEQQAALGWEAHGAYLFKGIEGPVEVFEAGERGHAPFRRPRDGANAERSKSTEEETTLGWRPAAEMEVPKRRGWRLVRRLGQGGFGEVWLAEDRAKIEKRVFKFCFDVVKLRSFKRELKLFEFIRQTLGPRTDIATLYDVQLETSPYFLESAYCSGGTLDEWFEGKLREGEVPLARRLAIMAAVARALAAAHSVGIIHKDVKPSNIFIEELPDGTVQPRLADFGIGELANRTAVEGLNSNCTGVWELTLEQTHSGTQMYCPPEYMVSGQTSILGDIYSLGVVLYQFVIADFRRPIGDGWRRDVSDDLLAEDIARCVDVKPELRLSSASLVAERLETLEQRRAELMEKEAAERDKRALEAKVLAQRKKTRLAAITMSVAAVLIAALGALAFVLAQSRNAEIKHSDEIARKREAERDQRYREDMIATIASIDRWRGEAARELVDRYRKISAGEQNRRGWEWRYADAVLNPPHLKREVSARPLRALAVSPDETSVAVAGDDGEVSIWSCDTLEKIDSWKTDPVHSMAWHGEILAIGLASGEVILREVGAKRDRARWLAHEGAVATMAWNRVSDELTTGGADGMLARWRSDGRPAGEKYHAEGPLLALDWDKAGTQLAMVLGNPARLWAGKLMEFKYRYAMHTAESAIAWRPSGGTQDQVAVSMKNMAMCAFILEEGFDVLKLDNQFSPAATAFAWAPNGARIAEGGVDGKIMIVAAGATNEKCPVLYGHQHPVNVMHWLKRERLLSVGDDGTLRAWDDLQRPPHVRIIDFSTPVTAARWHPGKDLLAVLVAGDEVQVFNAAREVAWMRSMPQPSRGHLALGEGRLAWSPDGSWLAATCPGRKLIAWRMDSDERYVSPDFDDATDLGWLDDNRTLLVRNKEGWWRVALATHQRTRIADERTIWLGDLGDGRIGKLTTDGVRARFSALNPDSSGRPLQEVFLPGKLGAIHACALNRQRTSLAVAGETGEFLWFDIKTGEQTSASMPHSSAVQAIGWHPDGSRLVTASSDGTCRVFDVAPKAPTWEVEHKLSNGIVAASWNFEGTGLMLASSQSHAVRIYEAAPASESTPTTAGRVAAIFAAIEEHPSEEVSWRALMIELDRSSEKGETVLRAAAQLGMQARFAPLAGNRLANMAPATQWAGVELPRAVRVAQACALERWDEVVALTSPALGPARAPWFALARAEALAQQGRRQESEAANLDAWRALRVFQAAHDPAAIATLPQGSSSSIDLFPFATAHPQEDWAMEDSLGSENNNFGDFAPLYESKVDGTRFRFGDFILLAGDKSRVTGGRMLPRSTGWIPVSPDSRQIACVVAACNLPDSDDSTEYQNTCIGSIFLLRADGGAVRIPLVFGQNIWRWWVPQTHPIPPEQTAAIAWTGSNRRAKHMQHDLALYQLNWAAEPSESPVVAISIISSIRQPAPLLMSVDARP